MSRSHPPGAEQPGQDPSRAGTVLPPPACAFSPLSGKNIAFAQAKRAGMGLGQGGGFAVASPSHNYCRDGVLLGLGMSTALLIPSLHNHRSLGLGLPLKSINGQYVPHPLGRDLILNPQFPSADALGVEGHQEQSRVVLTSWGLWGLQLCPGRVLVLGLVVTFSSKTIPGELF